MYYGQLESIARLPPNYQTEPSQTPIREALARLAAERLVQFIPYKGYAVSPLLTTREVADLVHVRKLLELDAVRQAASRINVLALSELEQLLKRMETLHPQPQFREYVHYNQLDQQFHEIIVAAADNAVLLETYRSLHVHVLLARFFRQSGEVGATEGNIEHRAIYAALIDHNEAAAVAAIGNHLDRAYLRAIQKNP